MNLAPLLASLAIDTASAETPAAAPLDQVALQAAITDARSKLTAEDVYDVDFVSTAEPLQPLIVQLQQLFTLQAQLDLGRISEDMLSFRFEHLDLQGYLKRGTNDTGEYIEIARGDETYYIDLTEGSDQLKVFLNDAALSPTDPRVLAAVLFAKNGLEKALAKPQFGVVDASKPAVSEKGGAVLRDQNGYIIEQVKPGVWVASVGRADATGQTFVYTDADADGRLEIGWLNVNTLSFTGAALTPAPAKPAPASAAPQVAAPKAPEVAAGNKLRVSSAAEGGLNLRAVGAPQGEVLGKIPVGTEVIVLKKAGDWVQVKFTDNEGKEQIGWAATRLGNRIFLEDASLPPRAPEVAIKMRVSTAAVEGLNLRDLGARRGVVIGKIPAGTEVTVLQIAGDWAQVKYKDLSGNEKIGWAAIRLGSITYLE